MPLAEAGLALEGLPTDPRARALRLRAAGWILSAWLQDRPEDPAASALCLRFAAAVDRHVAGGRLAWRALVGGGCAGADGAAHGLQVALDCAGLAHQLGWEAPARQALICAGLIHDVGWAVMPAGEPRPGEHALVGASLTGLTGPLAASVRATVRAHHERFDGKGSPLGLAGLEIPVGARALAVVDGLDGLRRTGAWSGRALGSALAAAAGAALDPKLVWACLALSCRRDDGWSA